MISILLSGMEILFSQDSDMLTDSLSPAENRRFFLQDIYVNYGNLRVSTDTLVLDDVFNLNPNVNLISELDTFNRASAIFVSPLVTSNVSLGTSFIMNPEQFDSRVTFRWDAQLNYRTGTHQMFNIANSDTLLSTAGTADNGEELLTDSIKSTYVGIIDDYRNYSFGTNFMINLKYFTTLDIYAGMGASFGFGDQNYLKYTTSLGEVHQRIDGAFSITNVVRDEYTQEQLVSSRFNSYSIYLPFGLNWQTAHYNKFFKHLIVSLDVRYGLRSTFSTENVKLSNQGFRYIGLGLKYRL